MPDLPGAPDPQSAEFDRETSALGMGKRDASCVPQCDPFGKSTSENDSQRISKADNSHREETGSTAEAKVQSFGNQPAGSLSKVTRFALDFPNSDKPKPKRESRTRYDLPEAREMGYARGCSRRRLSLVHILAECG